MNKFREKWSAALVFAIFLHLTIFFIFYINSSKHSLDDLANNKKNSSDHITVTHADNSDSPLKTSAYTLTLDKAETRPKIDSNQRKHVTVSEKPTPQENEKQRSNSQQRNENNNSYPIEPSIASNENAQKINEVLENEQVRKVTPLRTIERENLEDFENDSGLLDIDIPTQKTEMRGDESYEEKKSEVEKINNQLSAAISEVKKRNQQKIDQMQQQKQLSYDEETVEPNLVN
ncbi:hypothetical protein [Psychrobacter sp. W2-37-MNA-CIBAN-0211]|uniref:hypothetical protein n=1 Tax=Psychrobacter sp. W2-37-MNA-CIBAN-0211 TaxID=3140443 RepID=UPI003317C3F1